MSQSVEVSSPRTAADADSAAADADRPWSTGTLVALAGVCVAAGGLALRHLGTKPLWRDEAASLAGAHRPALSVLAMLPHHDADTGLYYVLLHVWLRLGQLLPAGIGHGEAWDRGLSVLFSVAAVAAAGWCARSWRGPVAGLAAAAFLGLNPFWLFYAQEARTYALALLLALVSTAALIGAVRHPSRRRLLIYGGATVLLLWADLFSIAFVGAQVAVLLGSGQSRPLRRTWYIVAGGAAPLALWMVAFEPYQISWIPTATTAGLWGVALGLGGGGIGLTVAAVLGLVAVAVAGGGGGGGAGAAAPAVAVGRRNATAWVAWLLAAATVVPPIALWVVSLVKPVLVDRYVIASVGSLVVLAGGGVAVLWERRHAVLATAAVVALMACWFPRQLQLEARPFKIDDSRAAARLIADQARPGDVVVYTRPGLRLLFDLYLPVGRVEDVALAAGQTGEHVHDLYPREVPSATLATRLDHVGRLWVVSDPGDGGWEKEGSLAPLRDQVVARLNPQRPASFGRLEVVLWSQS